MEKLLHAFAFSFLILLCPNFTNAALNSTKVVPLTTANTNLITYEEFSCSDGIQNGDETGVDCGGSCAPCEAQSQALVKHQGVFEELIQAPEVAQRHLNGYNFQYYQSNLIQKRKTLLDNYMAEDNHLLWGTGYTYASAQPLEKPLIVLGESWARSDEPYFSGAHPEYRRYSDYTNAVHVAAQYAFLFTQPVYENQNVTINGTTKLASEWAVDISLKVLQDLHETVTDDDLDIWNGTYRNNATWGTSARYVKGIHFRPINPYFVSVSKASAMWDSFALISQIISNSPEFLAEQTIIYDWLKELGEFVEAALDHEYEYYVPDWRSFGNYEDSFTSGSITNLASGSQNHYYFDQNGNGVGGKIHAAADVGNNRNMGHLEYLAKTGTYTEDNRINEKVKDFLRRVYEIATSAEGGNVDIQRNSGPSFSELNYTWIALSEIAMIAQHHANYTINSGTITGWDEIYALTHAQGVEDRFPSLDASYATGNPNKNLKLMLDYQAGFLNNSTRYAFDGERMTMDQGTGTVMWRSFQMFDGNQSSINNYLDGFNGQFNYDTSAWGSNEGLAAWHKWETIFGGPYALVDFSNLYLDAAVLRGETGDTNDGNPDDGNPDDGNPDDGNPDDPNPDDGNPDDGNPDDGNQDDPNPDDSNPDDPNGDETNPEEETPEEDTTNPEGEVGSIEATFGSLDVYPNPVREETLSIKANDFINSDMGVALYDLSGKQLLLQQKNTDQNGEMTLDVGFLIAGIYILNIWDLQEGNLVASKKVIKI